MSDLDDAIERLNPDASPKHLYRGPSSTADVEDDLRLVIAAVRCGTVAERMPEDVRELLTLARNARDAHERTNGDGDWYLYRQAIASPGGPERVLTALEAAYPQKGADDG